MDIHGISMTVHIEIDFYPHCDSNGLILVSEGFKRTTPTGQDCCMIVSAPGAGTLKPCAMAAMEFHFRCIPNLEIAEYACNRTFCNILHLEIAINHLVVGFKHFLFSIIYGIVLPID